MHFLATLLLITCACASANDNLIKPLKPWLPFPFDQNQIPEKSVSSFPALEINPDYLPDKPFYSPATSVSPIPPFITIQSLVLPSLLLPPGWCIPKVIRIPLVPCSKSIPTPNIKPIPPTLPKPWPLSIRIPLIKPTLKPLPIPAPLPKPWLLPTPTVLPRPWPLPISVPIIKPTPEPFSTPVPLPKPWPLQIQIPFIKQTTEPLPKPWPLPTPAPLPGPWPLPIQIPFIKPTPKSLPIPTPLHRPWPLPISVPIIKPTPEPFSIPVPLPKPWPLPTSAPLPRPWPIPIRIPFIKHTAEPIPIPTQLPKPWPLPIPAPLPIPWQLSQPLPQSSPVTPRPLITCPVWNEPAWENKECYLLNPTGFAAKYEKALLIVEQAVAEIHRHILDHKLCDEPTRQYLAILALWRRLQHVTSGNGLIISTPDYESIVQQTVSMALDNPALVAPDVIQWIENLLEATAGIRKIIQPYAEFDSVSHSTIANVVRQNPALQLEANLLLQLGDAFSSYLALMTDFNSISLKGCVTSYLMSLKYDVMQLVESFRPAMQSLYLIGSRY